MIDTHSHLLPWVDHGCPDLETSLRMAREAASSGIEKVVCTPHLSEWNEADIKQARMVIERVRVAVSDAGIDLQLLLGFEVDLGLAATADTKKLKTLAIEGSKGAILLEMPYTGWPVFMEETIFRLSTAGLVPVLAHPERNERVQRSSELLERCLKAGAVAQATASSVGAEFGRASTRAFYRLVAEGLISLLASDAHAHRTDNWSMASMLGSLDGLMAPDDLVTLTDTNPRRLLAGKALLPIKPWTGGTSWLRRRRPKAR